MSDRLSVTNAPKTATFQMRINPEIKTEVENIYARCGMTLTDAINVFIQQSINAGGLPMLVTGDTKEAVKNQAIAILMSELKKGEQSANNSDDWIPEEEIMAEFGIEI